LRFLTVIVWKILEGVLDIPFERKIYGWGLLAFSLAALGKLISPAFPTQGVFLAYFGGALFLLSCGWVVFLVNKKDRAASVSEDPIEIQVLDPFKLFYGFKFNRKSGIIRFLSFFLIVAGAIFLSSYFYENNPQVLWELFLFHLSLYLGSGIHLRIFL
jgi:hypothetical protein